MKLRSLRLEASPKLMIIPMIDIIFFLLVYFMLATLYYQNEQTIGVNLPRAATASAELRQTLAVNIFAGGEIRLGREAITLEALEKRIQAELARSPETTVVLRADRQAEYGTVVKVLDTLRLAGVPRLAVATEPLGPSP